MTKLPDGIGNVIISAVGGSSGSSGSSSDTSAVSAALNTVYDAGVKLVGAIYTGGYFDIIGAILAGIVLLAMVFFIGLCIAVIVANKLMLLVALSISPILIILAMFRVSSAYADGFIRLLVGLMLGIIFLYAFIGFYSQILTKAVNYAGTSGSESLSAKIGTITPFILVCIVGFYCVLQLQGMAQTISGGMVTGLGPGAVMAWRVRTLTQRGASRLYAWGRSAIDDLAGGGAGRNSLKASSSERGATALQNSLKRSGTAT